jgi:hypothetical protein
LIRRDKRIYCGKRMFEDALKKGRYERWIPWDDGYKVGEPGILVERSLNMELDMVCLDIRRTKQDGGFIVVFGLICGPITF